MAHIEDRYFQTALYTDSLVHSDLFFVAFDPLLFELRLGTSFYLQTKNSFHMVSCGLRYVYASWLEHAWCCWCCVRLWLRFVEIIMTMTSTYASEQCAAFHIWTIVRYFLLNKPHWLAGSCSNIPPIDITSLFDHLIYASIIIFYMLYMLFGARPLLCLCLNRDPHFFVGSVSQQSDTWEDRVTDSRQKEWTLTPFSFSSRSLTDSLSFTTMHRHSREMNHICSYLHADSEVHHWTLQEGSLPVGAHWLTSVKKLVFFQHSGATV